MEVGAELESGLGVEVHSWPWGNCWGLRSEGILLPTPFLQDREHVWSGFPAQGTTSKAAGPREPESAQTHFGLWRPEG